jgi:phosphate transport system permease protein
VDAARPMVFTTTMLLLVIVVSLNITAIGLRNRLRKRYAMSAL